MDNQYNQIKQETVQCESCNGWGWVKTPPTSIITEITSGIEKLQTSTCNKCNGKGKLLKITDIKYNTL